MTILETETLTKQFGELVAVDDMDLAVEEGAIHAVIGPNGAGKSTLFNLISGLLRPTEGQIYFKGEDITGLSPDRITRKGIGRSFQIVDVYEGLSVHENVRIATQIHDENHDSMWRRADTLTEPVERAEELLADIGLAELADQRADALSHGDRRRLDIALTMAGEPDLVLLDEPTAGMGKEDSIETIEMIRELIVERDITLVFIEHDVEIVLSTADTITVMHNGATLAEGTPDEIADDERVQRAYLGSSDE